METIYEDDTILIVQYSQKSLAFFEMDNYDNDTDDALKEFCSYNQKLNLNGNKVGGWIASSKNKKMLKFLVNEYDIDINSVSYSK